MRPPVYRDRHGDGGTVPVTVTVTKREGKAASTAVGAAYGAAEHRSHQDLYIQCFGAGISRPEIRAGSALPGPGQAGEQPLNDSGRGAGGPMGKPPSSGPGPRRRRGGPQVTVAVLASGSSSKAQAHAQAADSDVAGPAMGRGAVEAAASRRPGERMPQQPPLRSQR